MDLHTLISNRKFKKRPPIRPFKPYVSLLGMSTVHAVIQYCS